MALISISICWQSFKKIPDSGIIFCTYCFLLSFFLYVIRYGRPSYRIQSFFITDLSSKAKQPRKYSMFLRRAILFIIWDTCCLFTPNLLNTARSLTSGVSDKNSFCYFYIFFSVRIWKTIKHSHNISYR